MSTIENRSIYIIRIFILIISIYVNVARGAFVHVTSTQFYNIAQKSNSDRCNSKCSVFFSMKFISKLFRVKILALAVLYVRLFT